MRSFLWEQQRGGRGNSSGRWRPPPHNHHASVAPAAHTDTINLHLQLAVTRINGEHTKAAPADEPGSTPAKEGDALLAELVRLAKDAGNFPADVVADLEKGLLNDVWTGYVHMSCGAFVVPACGGREKVALDTIAALQSALNQGVALAGLVSPVNPSHLRQPVALVARSIMEVVNENRKEKARGAFYVLNVEFEQPEQQEAITALLQEVAQKTKLRLDLAGIAKKPHVTIRKYGEQHARRGYTCQQPAEVLALLNPLLAKQPLRLTCDIMQLVQPGNVEKRFVLCTKALAAPPLPAAAAAGRPVAARANPAFWQRPQPFWWAATSSCQRLSAALRANLQMLDESLAAAAVPGGGGAVDPQSMDRSDSGSSADSAVTAHQVA